MYHSHWGLEKTPFSSGLNPALFYEGASQRESLARLRFLVEHGRRAGLILGELGLGKSLLLEVFAQQCRTQNRIVAKVDLLGLSTREFFLELGIQLQAPVRVEDDLVRLFRKISDCIQETAQQDLSVVLLLDNADRVGADLSTQLVRLINLPNLASGSLSIVLACDQSRMERLGNDLLDLIDLRIDLQPWDELDTVGYMQFALVEAGSQRPLFEDEALSNMHRLAAGVPRDINRLAECALLVGSSSGLEIISSANIQSASQSIALPN